MNKHFYDSWASHVGLDGSLGLTVKKEERAKLIDNESLILPHHTLRLKDALYASEFIILPRFVFFPLSKWYGCNKVIERRVVQYQRDKSRAINTFKQKRSQSNTSLLPNQQQIPDMFYKVIGDITYELEVYPKFLYYEKITEKGERPHQKAIINRKVDAAYIKKNQGKLPFHELLISRKATFEEILRQMSATLGENYKRGRIWVEDQIISGAKLEETLEEYGASVGQVLYAEYANTSNQWPTDNFLAATKKQTTSGTPDSFPKTNGLYNLGNSKLNLVNI